jgi:o-succinylbenzoate synthase
LIDPILRIPLAVRAEARALVGAETREVAFLRLEDEATGAVGFGECAPLAGLHRETLDESLESIEEWFDGMRAAESLPPTAAFAVSCAMRTMDGLGSVPVAPVPVAGFAGDAIATLDGASLEELRACTAVKLKIGRGDATHDRALIAAAIEAFPGRRLRLDGNRRMTRAACEDVLRGFDAAHFEYLEEPLADPSELPSLSRATGVPIALDECVADRGAAVLREELARSGRVCAWVLRMSALGSLDEIERVATDAARLGADAVLSTAYESSYTLRLAVHIAARLPNARRAHGLGTARILLEDACEPARPRDGVLDGAPLPVPFVEAWS